MYVVQCPKCRQKMKVKQELHQVKVRCAHCKEVFLAETEEVSDSPAAAGAKPAPPASRPAAPKPKALKPQAEEPVGIDLGPAAPSSSAPSSSAPPSSAPAAPRVGPRVLRKKSNAPMFIVIGAGVLCIVFACFVVRQAITENFKFADGTVKRLYKWEVAEIQRKEKEENVAPAPANTVPAPAENTASHPPPPHTATQPASGATSTSGPAVLEMPPGEKADDVTEENAKGMSEIGDMPDKIRDKVQIPRPTIYPNELDPKTGVIVLEVQNLSDEKTIKTLNLTFEIINNEHVVGGTGDVKLQYIPPSAVMRYSVEYHLGAVGRGLRAVVSKFDYAPDDTVSWMVPEGLQFEDTNDGIKVSGHAKNGTNSTVRDIRVYGSFFNKRGEFIGEGEPVKLMDDKTSLVKDALGRFSVRFETHNKTIEKINVADIRVVGKKG